MTDTALDFAAAFAAFVAEYQRQAFRAQQEADTKPELELEP